MTHQMGELAADYALGVLDEAEAFTFEQHLLEGCEECSRDLEMYKRVAEELGFAAQTAEPSRRIRDELDQALNKAIIPAYRSIRSNEGSWVVLSPGIEVKRLHVDFATGNTTSLVRMAPGTSLPRHKHGGAEQFLVLEGDCNVNDERLGPGDFHCAEAGSVHETTYTESGTTFLLIAPENYVFESF